MLGKHQICMQCQQGPASVKLTKLVKGAVEELWLCHECAARHSPYQKKMAGLSLDALLAGILNQTKDEVAARPVDVDLACPTCGMPYETYRTSLLLGCSDCYEAFEKYLGNDLRKFHGNAAHRGRVPEEPAEVIELRRNPADLRRRLAEAVAAEDFEVAARLRDEIRRLGEVEIQKQS